MTEEGKDEEIELIPAEDNPWYKFYLQSIVLDRADEGEGPYGIKPHGWHWFWGIYFLHQKMPQFRPFNLTEIQKSLPDEHWLKNATDEENLYQSSSEVPDSGCQGEAMRALHEILQEHKITEAPEEIDFSNLDFKEHVNLSNFIFPIQVSFRDSKFHKSANFSQAIFIYDAYFDRTIFIDNDYFFDKGSSLSNTTFEDAVFHCSANFYKLQSSESLRFMRVKFIEGASFNNASFFGASFDNAEFINSGASFKKTKFSNVASFKETTFSNGAFFHDAKFDKIPYYANFSGANFASGTFFNDAKFSGGAFFYNAKFSSYTNFENAIFEIEAPKFYGAELNDEMLWTDIKLPKFEYADDETEDDYKKRIKDNQNAYENLSTKLGKQNKYHDEHFFFRHETQCRRKLAGNFLSRWAYGLYENVSNYGYGVGRAIATWFVHILIGALVLFGLRYFNCFKDFTYDFGCSVGISLSNSHAFFFNGDRLEKCYKAFETLPWFNVIWGLQTITGTLLIFLVLLTLRVRFRLK